MPGKFELYNDVRGQYRFRLISESGELILSGDGYSQKVLALDAIVSIMRSASEAAVIDLSLAGNEETQIEDGAAAWNEELAEAYTEESDIPDSRKRKRRAGKKTKKDRKSRRRKRSGDGKKKGKRKRH